MSRSPGFLWRRVMVWTTSVTLSAALAFVPLLGGADARSVRVAASAASSAGTPSADPIDTSAIDAALAEAKGDVSVTVLDLTRGMTRSYGDSGHAFDTASIVKVDILAALLLQAQDDGRTLTATEQSLAVRMIENSDNSAATTLFGEIGAKSGLEAANIRLGLRQTVVGSGDYWGLTQTTSTDQVRLLKQVFTSRSTLDAASRSYIRSLMGHVESTQRFGVSAAADTPSDAELKVGWLQRSSTGLWDVDSIGAVEKNGRSYLVAVLSDGNASLDAGVTLVDAVAKAAVDASI